MIRVINSNSRAVIDTSEAFVVREGVVADAGKDFVSCLGSAINIGGSPTASKGTPPYSFTWSSGQLSLAPTSNPLVSPDENRTYKVLVSDAAGCIGLDSVKVDISAIPMANFGAINDVYCTKAEFVELTAIPSGGNFTGDGIVNNVFHPAEAGAGVHQITYMFTDTNFCPHSITKEITVNATPEVSISGLNDHYNVKDALVNLTGMPEGGVFSGNGISGGIFSPSKAQLGINDVTYTYISKGCTGSLTKQVTIDNISTIKDLSGELCVNQFEIYPNNAVDNLTIHFEPCRTLEGMMALYDIDGKCQKIIRKGTLINEIISYHVSDLIPGVYFIIVIADHKLSYQKFIKKAYER